MKMSETTYASARPSGGEELWSWFFMRLSGLLLIFLVLGHFAIMHLIHPIENLNYDFVAGRYRLLIWRLYDLAMLLLALVHGLNGVRILIDDYLKGLWKTRAHRALQVIGILFILLGTVVILTFQPVPHV